MLTADVTTPEQAVEKSERLSAAVENKGTGSAFGAAASAALEQRRVLIGKHADRRPQDAVPVGRHGWTHGDVQYRNLLWKEGELAAVLDWDRVGVRPYAEEGVRTAQVQFGVDGVFDLARVAAFVCGYRSVVPLEAAALSDGVRRLWWKRMTDFWQLPPGRPLRSRSCREGKIGSAELWPAGCQSVRPGTTRPDS
ncbi:phosphotransferase [Streptomyces sp. SID13666]|uniref:phosphotransferase n=1 Tax=unclassified Streptomyces TaxID=2593676 RepID=UPI0013C1F2AD|nr:phosphotransferase [Streptomyces sp. SID13666]NEA72490.1 phosphotransferase [Streptomyces sp. SID13588]